MMTKISKTFLAGRVALLPVVGTIYLLFWLLRSTEGLLEGILRLILPESLYIPGMGVVLGILIVFMVGLFLRTWLVRRMFMWWESILLRLPVVKSIYGAIKDFITLFAEPGERNEEQVVAVRLFGSEASIIGFVTRSNLRDMRAPIGGEDRVAVYFPMSYQIGGYTVFVPRHLLEPIDMPFEEAMRFVLTAAVSRVAPAGQNTTRPE